MYIAINLKKSWKLLFKYYVWQQK